MKRRKNVYLQAMLPKKRTKSLSSFTKIASTNFKVHETTKIWRADYLAIEEFVRDSSDLKNNCINIQKYAFSPIQLSYSQRNLRFPLVAAL